MQSDGCTETRKNQVDTIITVPGKKNKILDQSCTGNREKDKDVRDVL